MRVSVLGCGRWGSFIAWYLNHIGHEVTLWGREGSKNLEHLRASRENGILTFDSKIEITSDLAAAVAHAEVLAISINSQNLRELLARLRGHHRGQPLVLCMKGIEEGTGLRLSEVAAEVLGPVETAVWVGPGHVQNFVKGVPNCMVIDANDDGLRRRLVEAFSSDLIRFYYGADLIGNEVGAAAKNVIGIAAGMLDGLGLTSLKGALISRGPREIARLIRAMGGDELSVYGLSHLGDFEATVFSAYSHNRRFGEAFVRGEPYDELAEGVRTTRALLTLGERYEIDLPICRAVSAVVHGGRDPREILSKLFMRSLKEEFY
ncbi:NAD(P)H-dependent glycerol-3-phosphate dehydrogenase [Feifania hominis]|uniref:Glycerol-3-phosphate dehydrogenase [NAD(P)+] n=1 Tax=Feifania hominis TaxID=2763660 RepID=A0A926HV45_9FIRM|nr:NAD(P)H-dependent glycerol-3-phosphate dehydrogenase [Feifania hominis]MBC8536958.1 NAD(P)H-dependent glycerol-3-phosphate dehydrogenase [Feifania hominis]